MIDLGAVDRSDDRPPYKQIADRLRSAVERGVLAPREKLPSEADLVEHYGVSRMTVRQAIQELRSEGLVDAEQGRGVFVRQVAPIRRLASDRFARQHRKDGKAAFIIEAEKSGVQPSVDQIRVSRSTPDAATQERLRLSPTDHVIVRERRYLANGIPVETAVSYIPADIADGTPIAEMNTGPGGIYARIEDAGHTLDHFTEEVSARMPTPDERRDLQLGASVPVIRVVRTAYDVAGRPVEVCDTIKAAPAYLLEYELPAR